ncbi:hypothetical protein K402DRAFT_334487 [Aulographum hederae CBS 113979]|uniref:Uncharacterized protein n=1 Tax=Aulographum hederae CBS 113979 TaxID=1176131 RepID=A0A6G1GXA9_9PEZI|nr:hypothetical protein K402DRAFT_334487 [Aulographum hederae CBS 113979]
MSFERSQAAATLPRNFTFHYTDPPKTPEPQERPSEDVPPLAPQNQVYKLKRRRAAAPTSIISYNNSFDQDIPIPTIEAPEPTIDSQIRLSGLPRQHSEGFLSPEPIFARFVSPPKTPVPQILSSSGGALRVTTDWSELGPMHHGEYLSRPSTASGLSDSSVESPGSMESFPSFGGSCTSPDSESADAFFGDEHTSWGSRKSPLRHEQPNKRTKVRKAVNWMPEMDSHLWAVYTRYLQDPTVTPFKILPGVAPPLGVCHRVAREAKRSWKGAKALRSTPTPSSKRPREGSPDTIKPMTSRSSTPTAAGFDVSKGSVQWPRSEAATRRRLRELCKRKSVLPAHYQRLMHTRSPSPFQSTPRASSRSRSGFSPMGYTEASFSTRDMNVSLATSTASTMQFGNPLSQLASDNVTPRPQVRNWPPHPPARAPAHHKSQSLQLGLGLGPSQDAHHVLASPFAAHTLPRLHVNTEGDFSSTRPQFNTAPRLGPPVELHAPVPLTRPFKRRTRFSDEETRAMLLEQLFGAPAESSHRRVRSRGFSLGDMMDGSRRLTTLFTPPPADDQANEMVIDGPSMNQDAMRDDANSRLPARLGSPISMRPPTAVFNTFPRKIGGQALEPPVSFEERLGGSNQSASPAPGMFQWQR